MFKSLFVPERLFRLAMWIVSLVFASFLIGLGGTIIGDLPRIEEPLTIERFADQSALQSARARFNASAMPSVNCRIAGSRPSSSSPPSPTRTNLRGRPTRTGLPRALPLPDPTQDVEVLKRTRQLDELQARQREVQVAFERIEKDLLDASRRWPPSSEPSSSW